MLKEVNTDWVEVGERVAREAGAFLRKGREAAQKINFEDATDVKLQADMDSEDLIRERLSNGTGLAIIGEEQGGDEGLMEGSEYYWVVDPLDGTYNYLRNQPETCVSIGLMRGKEHVFGVIYDFNSDTLYSGRVGDGLYINGEKHEPRWETDSKKACIMTGFPAGRDYSEESLNDFVLRVQTFKKVRMIGSAALAVAYVAAGRADAYFEESVKLWDVAAGGALVLAAGGHMRILPTGEPFTYNCWAVGNKDWIPQQ